MSVDATNSQLNVQAASTIADAETELIALTAGLSGEITDDDGTVCGTANFGSDSHTVTADHGKKDVSLVEFMEYSGKSSRKVQGATDAMSEGKNIMKSTARATKNS